MTAPLAGLEVLDLTSGPAGGLATMVLADFGARVIRFPDTRYDTLNHMPSARMWLRGKTTARVPVHEAVKHADVLVITRPNGFSGCDYEALHRINPALVYADVSAFGDDRDLPLNESVVAAAMGRMKGMEGLLAEPGPRYAAVQVATHATAMNVVSGVLAALHERGRSGAGQRVATSLAHGLIPYDQGASLAMQIRQKNDAPAPAIDPASIMPTLNYHPVQCADGRWIQLGNLLPHLFANFMQVIGLADEMDKLPDGREQVRDAILTRMQTKTSDEWMQLFIADGGIAAHPYQSAEEALDDPDMVANGHVIEIDGVRQPGPLARFSATPATPGGTDSEHAKWQLPAPLDVPDTGAPLRNVTVIELATIIAAPLAASFLADLGARVIKVEAIGGDPYRGMGGGYGATRCNHGKESISIDLKSGTGKALLHELVKDADILIHNYRPGVPERLGIGYEQLQTLNPGLVYVSANGYGPDGPGALRPSTHPIPGAAIGGAGYQAGGVPQELLDLDGLREAARRLMRANEVNPDPNTALVICASAIMGLVARDRTGEGQRIFGDMFIANAYANFDDCVAFAGKPPRPPLDDKLLGIHALRRLYACEDGWVFLGIDRLDDWETFCEIVAARHLLSHYPDPGEHPRDELASELAALFATNTAQHFEDLLLARGIGCVVADRCNLPEFFFDDCGKHAHWMIPVEHPTLGTYYRHKPMLEFSRSRLRPGGATPGGYHSRALARQLGYDDTTVDAMFEDGVLWADTSS